MMRINPRFLATLILVQITMAIPGSKAQAALKHPGCYLSLGELQEMRRRVNSGVQPQKQTYDKMKSSSFANKGLRQYPATLAWWGSNEWCISDWRIDGLNPPAAKLSDWVRPREATSGKGVSARET